MNKLEVRSLKKWFKNRSLKKPVAFLASYRENDKFLSSGFIDETQFRHNKWYEIDCIDFFLLTSIIYDLEYPGQIVARIPLLDSDSFFKESVTGNLHDDELYLCFENMSNGLDKIELFIKCVDLDVDFNSIETSKGFELINEDLLNIAKPLSYFKP